MDEGTPKRKIQPLIKALATVAAVLSAIGIASGHRVNQSTTVSKKVHPSEGGRGPTISRWSLSNRASGLLKFAMGVVVWRCILAH